MEPTYQLNVSIPANIDALTEYYLNSAGHTETEAPPIQVSRYLVENWIQYKADRNKNIYRQLGNIFEYFIAIIASLLVSLAYRLKIGSQAQTSIMLGIIAAIWAAFYMIRAIRVFITLVRGSLGRAIKMHKLIISIKNLVQALGYSMLCGVCVSKIQNVLTMILISMLVGLIGPFVVFNKSTNACFTFIRAVKFVIGFFRFITIFILLMKYTNSIQVNSSIVFLPCWLFMALCALAFLFCGTITGYAILVSIKERRIRQEST
jgi:bacterioferritin-associated ferredoxin